MKINLFLMGSSGLEPPTSRLSGARSNQLSYEPACRACSSSACLRAFTRFHHQLKSLFTTTMEMMGFEPMTPCLQGRCSPNWATPPCSPGPTVSFLFFRDLSWSLKIEQQIILFSRLFLWVSFLFSNFLANLFHLLPFSIERRWSSRTFRYGYLVTT